MATRQQDTLTNEQSDQMVVTISYRNVKSNENRTEISKKSIKSPSKLDEIRGLIEHIKNKKLKHPIDIQNSSMNELPREFCENLLRSSMNDTDVRYLLSQFCDSLKGQQRSGDKYAMLVHMGTSFLLAHVRAERGMSINQNDDELGLIHRFLDIDNILSAALFKLNSDGDIILSNFTDTGSTSFRSFLGVSEKKYHYIKKNVQVVCFYEGRAGLECKFEFSNEDLEKEWLSDGNVTLGEDRFTTKSNNSHIIRYIRWGGEQYDSVRAFKTDFKQYSYDLNGERRRYDDLLNSPSGNNNSVFADDIKNVVEKEQQVEIEHEDGKERKIITKGKSNGNIHAIYSNKIIRIDPHFANRIFTDILEGNETAIYHPSGSMASNELIINDISILNVDQDDIPKEHLEFLEELHSHVMNLSGEGVSRCLCCVFLYMISDYLNRTAKKAIGQIMNVGRGAPRNKDIVSSKENEVGGLVEFKNKKDLEKRDPAESIVDNIKTEMKNGDEKVFIWGITEQNRSFNGLNTQSWNDDRVSSIESKVTRRLDRKNIDYNDFIMQPIALGEEGTTWVVCGVLY